MRNAPVQIKGQFRRLECRCRNGVRLFIKPALDGSPAGLMPVFVEAKDTTYMTMIFADFRHVEAFWTTESNTVHLNTVLELGAREKAEGKPTRETTVIDEVGAISITYLHSRCIYVGPKQSPLALRLTK